MMQNLKLTSVLLTGCFLLCGCSSQEGIPKQENVSPSPSIEVQNGYASAEEAYSDYLKACLAGDADALYVMYSADEKAAASQVSAEYLDLNEEGYASYTELLDDGNFQRFLQGYMNSLQANMKTYNSDPDEWGILPGISDGTEDAQAFADATGLDVQGLVSYHYYFVQENKEDGAALAGKKVSMVQLGDKWYPSYVYEIRPDLLSFME